MFSSGAADLFSALIIFLHQDFTVHTSILIDDFFFQRNNAVEKTRHFFAQQTLESRLLLEIWGQDK